MRKRAGTARCSASNRQAIALRHSHSALRTGAYRTLVAAGGIFGFSRSICNGPISTDKATEDKSPVESHLIVLFNRAKSEARLAVPLAGEGREGETGAALSMPTFRVVWPPGASGQTYCARNGTLWDLTIPPREALILEGAGSSQTAASEEG